jgi:hypothetical protein
MKGRQNYPSKTPQQLKLSPKIINWLVLSDREFISLPLKMINDLKNDSNKQS